MRDNYDVLKTEGRNPRTMDIDKLSSLEMVRLINRENRAVEDGIDEALAHIATYSSKHSECIVAECPEAQARFGKEVDAACVYANVPTSFTDGGQFGFGAEIGISTQKLHARGPMGLPEITTYKYLITGNGQIRNS